MPHEIVERSLRDEHFALHPVHQRANAADQRAREARYDAVRGAFSVPARTAVVFVAH